MNKVFRIIWSAVRNKWIVVSERAGSKGCPMFTAGVLSLAALMALSGRAFGLDASALPTGGQITSGSGLISANGSQMTVTQSSQQMIAQWDSFNIGESAGVRFNQPNSSAVALNRINDPNPSRIMGSLSSNGQLFLLNTSGIVFGKSAQVDVGGLVASSLNMLDSDFLSGKYVLANSGNSGAVLNQGAIRTIPGGVVALIAPKVANTGSITVYGGSAMMAAGDRVKVDFNGDDLITYAVEQGTVDALVENSGLIKADGGVVVMTAKAADALTSAVVNNSGIVEARGFSCSEGRIILDSGDDLTGTGQLFQSGSLDVSSATGTGGAIELGSGYSIAETGTLSATGTDGGSISVSTGNLIETGRYDVSGSNQGGSIVISASNSIKQVSASVLNADGGESGGGTIRIKAGGDVLLSGTESASGKHGGIIEVTAPQLIMTGATLNARGSSGGGRVFVGGGWQGSDAGIVNAMVTHIADTKIDVSATEYGSGGTAAVWSENETLFGGDVRGTGGSLGGDGGQVEVSSRGHLGFGAKIDVSAPHGKSGDLLLDPKNIEIVAGVSGLSFLNLPDPTPSNEGNGTLPHFGAQQVLELLDHGVSIKRIVVVLSNDDAVASKAGGVYLYDSTNGSLVSAVTGSHLYDMVGNYGVTPLNNGNFVISSTAWGATKSSGSDGKGAATLVKGLTGEIASTGTIGGAVTASNSLTGASAYDKVGSDVVELENGNYVVESQDWGVGGSSAAYLNKAKGAVTLVSGTTGIISNTGTYGATVSSMNSLAGSVAGDNVGRFSSLYDLSYSTTLPSAQVGGVYKLGNGNYVVCSPYWGSGGTLTTGKGAVTFVNGSTGNISTTGGAGAEVSSLNSLVGSTTGDLIGLFFTELSNHNYVVSSPCWDNGGTVDAGAVTWASGVDGHLSGTTSAGSVVSSANSLVGSSLYDKVGSYYEKGIIPGSPATPPQTITNYINGVKALQGNGNYVVTSPFWGSTAGSITTALGAVTWGNGASGTTGVVSTSNSMTGQRSGDRIGYFGAVALPGGNYVVSSPFCDNGTKVDAGAVTWGSGTSAQTGYISSANSLVGAWAGDYVGTHVGDFYNINSTANTNDLTILSDGNYVVGSSSFKTGVGVEVGAVTWLNGSNGYIAGTSSRGGVVSSTNSLVGSINGDWVGIGGVYALNDGHYVVNSSSWHNGTAAYAGAVTWIADGAHSMGIVSAANSLVGDKLNDKVGYSGIAVLSNGNYVVDSPEWSLDASNHYNGAVTWVNGSTGFIAGTSSRGGVVSSENSLIGDIGDHIGSIDQGARGVVALPNGNYVVASAQSQHWYLDGATWIEDAAGAVTWVNGSNGNIAGTSSPGGMISLDNSLWTLKWTDKLSANGPNIYVNVLTNGNYVLCMPYWDNQATYTNSKGAVSWVNGSNGNIAGTSSPGGLVSITNSLVGSAYGDQVGRVDRFAVSPAKVNENGVVVLPGGNYAVSSRFWDNGSIVDAGAVTWGNGTSGVIGALSSANSFVGTHAGDKISGLGDTNPNGASALSDGRVIVASPFWYNQAESDPNTFKWVYGRVDILDWVSTPFSNLYFSDNASGNSVIKAGDIAAQINLGTNVIMQANNDIILSGPIAATGGGLPGSLTLQAGRSILLNADIVTNDDLVTIVANENDITASGVHVDQRDAGAAVVTMAPGTTIDTGTGALLIQLKEGSSATDPARNASGDITLGNLRANTITVVNSGPTAGSGITLLAGSQLRSGALSGNGIVLAADEFINNAGSSALLTESEARWLVWSGNPINDNRGGLDYSFKQYDANYGVSSVLGSGNGFLYTYAPDLTVSLTGTVEKVYNRNLNATLSTGNYSIADVIDGDIATISKSSGSYDTKDVGNGKLVTVTGLSLSDIQLSNGSAMLYGYKLANGTAAGNVGKITQASLTISGITAEDKRYDATKTATVESGGSVYGGLYSGDDVKVTASGEFTDKNVGSSKTVNLTSSYSGADKGNYAITEQQTTTASISQASLTISGITASDRSYDSTKAATVESGGAHYTGLYSGDEVTVASSGEFTDKNVGSGKTVNLTSSYSGADKGNYTITDQQTTTASITQATLTISGITAEDKRYDATKTATVESGGTVYGGLYSGDDVKVTASGEFTDKNVGSSMTVNLTSGYSGADKSNYAITGQQTTTASITQAPLTISGITASDKIYDATKAATVESGGTVYGGLYSGDDVKVTASGEFTDKNVGSSKTVNLTSSYSGADKSNYAITDQQTTTASISQASLTISGITAEDRSYDATKTAAVNTGGAHYTGLYRGDEVTVAASGEFTDKNVGSGKTVNLTSSYSGADKSNYAITDQQTTTASITPAPIDVTGLLAQNKVYDGTTDAKVSIGGAKLNGIISDDDVQLTGTAKGLFDSPDVGTDKRVSVSGLSIGGADGDNYQLQDPPDLTADIEALPKTAPSNNRVRIYDEPGYKIEHELKESLVDEIAEGIHPKEVVSVSEDSVESAAFDNTMTSGGNDFLDEDKKGDGHADGQKSAESTQTAIIAASSTHNPEAKPQAIKPPGKPDEVLQNGLAVTVVNVLSMPVEKVPGVIAVTIYGDRQQFITNSRFRLPEKVRRAVAAGAGSDKFTILDQSVLPSWLQYDSRERVFTVQSVELNSGPLASLMTIGNTNWTVTVKKEQWLSSVLKK